MYNDYANMYGFNDGMIDELNSIGKKYGCPEQVAPYLKMMKILRKCIKHEDIGVIESAWSDVSSFREALVNGSLYSMPAGVLLDIISGAEILGYFSPVRETRDFWYNVYILLVSSIHLHAETKDECMIRYLKKS